MGTFSSDDYSTGTNAALHGLVITLSFLSYLSLNGFFIKSSPANQTQSENSRKITDKYVCKDGTIIIIEGYFITKNSSRILKAVKYSLEYLEENAGKFPHKIFRIIETLNLKEELFTGGFNIKAAFRIL